MCNAMRRIVLWVVLVLCGSVAAQDLPTDPRYVRGELANGMAYIVRRHENPPGRAAFWLHVSTGSLNESESQRGAAHYLEHLAFNGSANFPPGSVIPFFESLGLTFGQHQNAYTSFDQTVYQLELPDTKPETVGKALLFLSDVAGRLSLLPVEIDDERQVIMEERRSRMSGAQRVQDEFLARLSPGSLFGRRSPIGVEETLARLGEPEFRDYYSRFYVPSNMTLLAVADMPEADVVKAIESAFGGGERAAVPADADPGIRPPEASRAIVLSDAEISQATVSAIWLGAPRPSTKTEPQLREELVRGLGVYVLNRRLQAAVNEGKVAFLSGSATSSDLFRGATISQVAATGKPESWPAMLADLGRFLQAARQHGFRESEIEDVRRAVLAAAEREVETDATQPATRILGRVNAAVPDREPLVSPEQGLEIMRRLLPTITPAEVSAAFASVFPADSPVIFHAEMPSAAKIPTEEELVAAGTAALSVTTEAEGERVKPASILASLPEPGTIAERTEFDDGKIAAVWLSNGARVWHRFSDYRKDQVIVAVSFAGGLIEETSADRGISESAALAWRRPATGRCTSTDIRDLLVGKKVQVGGGAQEDTMGLTAVGSVADLEVGMQLMHALLTDPVIEAPGLAQWQDEAAIEANQRRLDPEAMMAEVLPAAVYPEGQARVRPLEADQARAITVDAAQARLRRVITTAPMEVVVVGEIEREAALALVARYIGSLPARERISADTLRPVRSMVRPKGPIVVERPMKTATDKAVVLAGFYSADYANIAEHRRLLLASRILTTRAITEIREAKQLAYSPGVGAVPGMGYPGFGLFYAYSTTAVEKRAALVAAFNELFDRFAKDGPTPEEMETAKKQTANSIDQQLREPGYWASRLGTLTYRGVSVEALLSAPAAYQALTTEEVRDAVARHRTPEGSYTISIWPEK